MGGGKEGGGMGGGEVGREEGGEGEERVEEERKGEDEKEDEVRRQTKFVFTIRKTISSVPRTQISTVIPSVLYTQHKPSSSFNIHSTNTSHFLCHIIIRVCQL